MTLAALALVPAIAMSQSVPEQPARARRGPALGLAIDATVELGGEDFLEVVFEDGGTQKLRAGQGGTLSVGGIVRPSEGSPLSLRGTIGFKFVTTAADNANIRFTRVPLELVAGYQHPRGLRAGAGVVYHAANKFHGDGFFDDVSFSGAAGFTAELGYRAVALTYTAISYGVPGGASLDGGSIGLQLLWTPTRRRR